MWRWLWLSGIIIGLDQLTKWLATIYLVYQQPYPLLPYFNLTLLYNSGAAFSFLADASGWQRWFLFFLALIISTDLLVLLFKLNRQQRWQALGLALILGGALGNMIDRALYGYVIDFIHLYYQQWSWPAFNIADSAITVGAIIWLADSLRGHKTAATVVS